MTQDEKKRAAAEVALEHVPAGEVVGVGTGSTVNFLIDALARIKHRLDGIYLFPIGVQGLLVDAIEV